MDKVRVGITIGDINGIGLEVIIKTLTHPKIVDICTPVVYGSSKVLSYHKNIVDPDGFHFTNISDANSIQPGKINLVNCWSENVNINLGSATEEGGKYAYISLDRALRDIQEKALDAIVTAPINKKAMSLANFGFTGHTEYFEKYCGTGNSLMMMVGDYLRVGLATAHIPLSEVSNQITKQGLIQQIQLLNKTLKVDFGIEKPVIAVLGLNPHASDDGVIGEEEEKVIRPAIVECRKNGMLIGGPISADGFFGSGEYRKVDAVFAMYHDQGLIPFKTISFGKGVNFTAGLNIVRTSPDHGTAYGIAGKNEADPDSFRAALYLAIDILKRRKEYNELTTNPLKKAQYADEENEGTSND